MEIERFIYLKAFRLYYMATSVKHHTMADVVRETKKGYQGKHRWIERYLERLQSEKGMAAEAILKVENARRQQEGVKEIKLRSIERVLNEEGFPLYGTARATVVERRDFITTLPPTEKGVGRLIQRVREEVVKLEQMMKAVALSPAEQEFCYLWMENYPNEVIAGLMDLGDTELKEMKEKLGLGRR